MNKAEVCAIAKMGVLFSGLDDEQTNALLTAAAARHYLTGSALFHQGDLPSHLFQLCTGLVRMTQVTPLGAQTTIRLMGPGDLVGCVAVFQQFPFPATATANQESTVLSWSASQMADLRERYPAIAANALKAVGDRAKEMVSRVVELNHGNVERRIANVLLRMAEQIGRACDNGIELELRSFRKDIAEMSGVTYFTVSRTLSAWSKQGLVRNGRERILIISPEKIAEIAA